MRLARVDSGTIRLYRFGLDALAMIFISGGDAMSNTERSHVEQFEPCPQCRWPMKLVIVKPSSSVLRANELTYRCYNCSQSEKFIRQVK